MEPPGGRDSRFQLGYSMNLLSGESPPEIYGNPLGRPSTSLQQLSPRHTMVSSNQCGGGGGGGGNNNRGGLKSDVCYDERGMTPQHGMGGFDSGNVNDIHDEPYSSLQSKKSPPSNGKKTKGRVKIKMEYIENKLRRYTTFSKRKTGIMKKAYELSTLTGTQVMLLVASETGHVYTFATRKLQPMITSEAGKALIQTCLNSPDPPVGSAGGDQRMSATGFEETELTYNISDEDSKDDGSDLSEGEEFDDDGSDDEEEPPKKVFLQSEIGPPLRSHSPPSIKSSDSSSSDFSKKPTDNKIKLSSKISSIKSDEDSEKSSIIDQIKQINNALIQSNKAKSQHQPQSLVTNSSSSASSTSSSPPTPQSSSLSSASVLSSLSSTVPSSSSSTSTTTTLQNTPSSSFQLTNSSSASSMQNPIQSQVVVQLNDNIKAVPLIIQTGTGMAFASVSEGMILGVIQGSESQFVAMPLNSVVTSEIIGNGIKIAQNR